MKKLSLLLLMFIFCGAFSNCDNKTNSNEVTVEEALSYLQSGPLSCQYSYSQSIYSGTDANGNDLFDYFWKSEPTSSYQIEREEIACGPRLTGSLNPSRLQLELKDGFDAEISVDYFSVSGGCNGTYSEDGYLESEVHAWDYDAKTITIYNPNSPLVAMEFDRFEVINEEYGTPNGTVKVKKLYAFSSQDWFDYYYLNTSEESHKSKSRFDCTLSIVE